MRARFEREEEEAQQMTREQREELRALLPEGRIVFDEPMSRHSTIGVGGPAEAYVMVADEGELARIVEWANERGIEYCFWGAGSNVLVRDKGLRGLVIKLGDGFGHIEVDREDADRVYISVGAAVSTTHLVRWCVDRGFSGIEPLAGIPGTVGGNILTNAGTGQGSISNVVEELTIVNRERRVLTIRKAALRFEYRQLRLPRTAAVIRVLLRLGRDDPKAVARQVQKIQKQRQRSQPQGVKSLGCIFRNPGKTSSGMLIEDAGLKDVRIGGARVSSVHANFIVNEGGATSRDVIVLMSLIRDRVKQQSGISLEPEIKIVGRKK